MEDREDAYEGGATRSCRPSLSGGGIPARPSDMQTAARHTGSRKLPALAWVARKRRRQAASAVGRGLVPLCLEDSRCHASVSVLFQCVCFLCVE